MAVSGQLEYTYQDSGLTAGLPYTYTLTAIDKAGNLSPTASLEITPGTDGTPPAVPVISQVVYRPGGAADIYWPRNADDLNVDHYQVFRATAEAGGQFGEPAPLEPQITADHRLEYEFHDTGLLSQKTYAYTVRAYNAAGTASAPSTPYELTTPALTASLVSYRFPLEQGRADLGFVNSGAELTIRVVGERGRQASAVVEYRNWLDADGGMLSEPRTVTTGPITLSERPDLPGTYQGIFTLPDKTTQISSLSGTLSDGAGHVSPAATAAGLPLTVAGSLRVEIPGDALTDLAYRSLVVSSLSAGQSFVRNITDATAYIFTGLKPAEDYTVRLRNHMDRLLINQEEITVAAGEETMVPADPLRPAGLRVQVLTPGGIPVPGASVRFSNPYTVMTVITDENGWAESRLDFLSGEEATAVITLSGPSEALTCFSGESATYTLDAGMNVGEIKLRSLPMFTVSGTATVETPTGPALGGVVVTTTQLLEGRRSYTATTVTGNDGRYSLTLPAGGVTVSAGTPNGKYVMNNRFIGLTETFSGNLDLVLTTIGKVEVDITIRTKYLDREETVTRNLNWASAAHYKLKATDARGIVSSSYPFPLRGAPGEEIKISVDGREAGLPRQEQTAILDDHRRGAVTFSLEEQGRIIGRVVDGGGRPIDMSDALLNMYRYFSG
ncbi:MAG: hypothetical protein RBT41_02195, partial [Clostridia bacterium]|nr:hypothetical protein [Clostridia bacterium]